MPPPINSSIVRTTSNSIDLPRSPRPINPQEARTKKLPVISENAAAPAMFPRGPLRPWRAVSPPMLPYPLPAPYAGAMPMLPYPLPAPYAGMVPFAGPPPRFPAPHFAAAVHHPAPFMLPSVQLQSVTAVNSDAELDQITALLDHYSYVTIDTEYPGTVHRPPAGTRDSELTADERYAFMKDNVDELPIVQLGITLCDEHGNLPVVVDYATGHLTERAWEFNFSDFDVGIHRHAPQSVEFLRSQGIDFERARECGVSSAAFKEKLAAILSAPRGNELTWVAFGGAYDLAYLVKMLGDGQPLPATRQEFMARVRELLGGRVFDAKYMAENCGRSDLRNVGLRTVAANLGVPRPMVEPCLAGPKSLTACRIHTVLRVHVLSQDDVASYEGRIDGLH